MCDEWMPDLTFPLTLEQFHQLPRNAAYRYDHLNGQVFLTPRPRHFHAVLNLATISKQDTGGGLHLRLMQREDIHALENLFVDAFRWLQPFGSLDEATLQEAAHQCLKRASAGGDGPLIEGVSFVAVDEKRERLVGADFITLLPLGDPCDQGSYYWKEPPPVDCIERRLGRPHLTWIFVGPLHSKHGLGTVLLEASARKLLEMGFTELLSTFLLGNDSTLLWHWRNGFRLLPHPTSFRHLSRMPGG
jgi:GNAT superfamily N-acetyltransferase